MEIGIGDKVRFLNAIGGGIVSHIEGRTIYVEDEDGFEIPVTCNELVVVEHQTAQQQQEEKKQKEKQNEIQEIKVDASYTFNDTQSDDSSPRFALAFLKSDKGNSGYLDLHIVNDSNYFIFFSITEHTQDENVRMLHYGTIEPNTKLMLDRYNPQRIDNQTWQCQLTLFKKSKIFKCYQPISNNIKIKSSKFFHDGGFVDNDFFNEKAVIYQVIKDELQTKIEELSEKDFHKIAQQKEHKEQHQKSNKKRTNEIIEIDLHIDEILDSTIGLSNGDMLEAQIQRFRNVMEDNIHFKGQRIVFIHGVGNGVLKAEVRKILEREYRKCYFQDASFKEYGYGATMVTIQ